MQQHNYLINPSKNESVVAVFGPNSQSLRRRFRDGQLPLAGRAQDRARLLGGILRADSTFASELPC
eukprot:6683970-Pyramimonas_sp.AAC.1